MCALAHAGPLCDACWLFSPYSALWCLSSAETGDVKDGELSFSQGHGASRKGEQNLVVSLSTGGRGPCCDTPPLPPLPPRVSAFPFSMSTPHKLSSISPWVTAPQNNPPPPPNLVLLPAASSL
uniref:Uncharacterized protein n=1 Tax=Ixodes ricinus TaxID=34613 RepID=A0A6B0UNZ5_IXORI